VKEKGARGISLVCSKGFSWTVEADFEGKVQGALSLLFLDAAHLICAHFTRIERILAGALFF